MCFFISRSPWAVVIIKLQAWPCVPLLKKNLKKITQKILIKKENAGVISDRESIHKPIATLRSFYFGALCFKTVIIDLVGSLQLHRPR